MIGTAHRRIAALLAALATFGLVLAPVLHASVHAREAAAAHDEAVATIFRLAFEHHRTPAQEQALRTALDEAFGGSESDPAGRAHSHSHGAGSHGSGSLEHLGLAIHGPPPPAAEVLPPSIPAGLLFAQSALFLTPRYSTPEHSQGPPAV